MPIYLGKKANELQIPSGTISEISGHLSEVEDVDFLNDPEEHRDLLPQPFRLINKIMGQLFDDSWDQIEAREEERKTEKQRILPPKSDLPLVVQGFKNGVNALAGTQDGRFIIIGLKNGLAILDALSLVTLDSWEYPNFELIPPITIEPFGANSHLIAARDDMGGARLFAVMEGRIYLIRTLYEGSNTKSNPSMEAQGPGNSEKSKNLVHQFDLAEQTDFCAVTVEVLKAAVNNTNENTTINREIYVEIYRLPKEQWLKELENLHKKYENEGGSGSGRIVPKDNESDEILSQANKEDSRDDENVTLGSYGDDRTSSKFGAPILCFKCRPNHRRVNVVSNSVTIPNFVKSLNINCDVLGSGTNHLYSMHHLQQRKDLFEQGRHPMREHYERYLASDSSTDPLVLPTIHFLRNGPLLPVGIEEQSAAFAIWWEAHNHLKFYSLAKFQGATSSSNTKDVEPKADILWTYSSNITASTVSKCGSLLALGLHSGNIIVFDYSYGLQRTVQHVSDSPLIMLDFLIPSHSMLSRFSLSLAKQLDLSTERPQTYLIAVDSRFQYYLQDCGATVGLACKPPQFIKSSIKYPSDATAWMTYIPSLPTMILRVTHSGQIVFHDVSRKQEIIEFQLPPPYSLWQPWQPCICVAGHGQTMCVKVSISNPENVQNGDNDEDNETRLLFFPLRHMNLLKNYWSTEELPLDSLKLSTRLALEQRAFLYLKHRNSSFLKRQEEIQNCWNNAKQTFLNIMKEKELKEKSILHIH